MSRSLPLLSCLLCFVAACAPVRDNDQVVADRGEPCADDIECGPGLVCAYTETCEFLGEPGTSAAGDECITDGDCRVGLGCNGDGRCGTAGASGVGGPCRSTAGCLGGLVCAADGLCAGEGEPGTLGENAACEADAECRFGLVCGPDGACDSAPRWAGVDCEGSIEPGPARVLFEVPRGDALADYYRLPSPNDARARAGGVDRAGFPGVDRRPNPGDLLGQYLAATAAEGTGFGPASAVVFRFSAPVDYGTLDFGGDAPNFLFVDVTPGGDTRGRSPRSRFYATGGRSRFICPNWLGIRPSEGTPLTGGHTYAVLFRRGLTDTNGVALQADDDLEALLAATPPAHPALAAAWNRYAPLRSWLADEEIPAEDIIGAAVFTTNDARARVASVRDAVLSAPAPEVEAAEACEAGASPCGGRSCGPMSGAYHEVHARVALTSFLRGVPPYGEWGGDAVYVDGRPQPQRRETVCAVVTVPRGEAPQEGWPVALFAHDLGGHAGTALSTGLAGRLAEAGWATVGYDGLLHGSRVGLDSMPDAEAAAELLDDPRRPALMRDQMVQGAADLFALTRLVQSGLEVPIAGGTAPLRTGRLAFVGHGRGGVYGVPFAAYEPTVEAVVYAGVGGDLVDWLAKRTAPRDLATELAIALAENDFNGMHPALHLMQTWLDPRDPVNYGELLRRPIDGVGGKHVLFMYGVDDPITPPSSMNHLAVSMRLSRVGPERAPLSSISEHDGDDARGNNRIGGADWTQGLKQYDPDGGDGHMVLFDHPQAREDLSTFMRGLLEGDGIPTISGD